MSGSACPSLRPIVHALGEWAHRNMDAEVSLEHLDARLLMWNMRRKIEGMQSEVNEFMDYVKRELARGIDDWEQRLGTALVKSSPTDRVRHSTASAAAATEAQKSKVKSQK